MWCVGLCEVRLLGSCSLCTRCRQRLPCAGTVALAKSAAARLPWSLSPRSLIMLGGLRYRIHSSHQTRHTSQRHTDTPTDPHRQGWSRLPVPPQRGCPGAACAKKVTCKERPAGPAAPHCSSPTVSQNHRRAHRVTQSTLFFWLCDGRAALPPSDAPARSDAVVLKPPLLSRTPASQPLHSLSAHINRSRNPR